MLNLILEEEERKTIMKDSQLGSNLTVSVQRQLKRCFPCLNSFKAIERQITIRDSHFSLGLNVLTAQKSFFDFFLFGSLRSMETLLKENQLKTDSLSLIVNFPLYAFKLCKAIQILV